MNLYCKLFDCFRLAKEKNQLATTEISHITYMRCGAQLFLNQVLTTVRQEVLVCDDMEAHAAVFMILRR